MAGHSKWANIQHRKGKQDALRGKLFSKLAREIAVAAKMGDPNPDMNPRLRLAIATAKQNSMPKDNIDKAIAKGANTGEGADYQDVRYEGYAPNGVAVIIEALTDNRNRAAGEIRATLSKHGGNLGETGCVGFMFDRVGELAYASSVGGFDDVFEIALEAGAEDVESDDEFHTITCAVDDFATVRDALEAKFGEPARSGLVWRPNVTSAVDDENAARKIIKLVEVLEDNDDVQNVTTNAEFDDKIMQALMEG